MQIGTGLIQDHMLAGRRDIVARYEWQPEIVVRESRADTSARRRMPPMLHVAGLELARGRLQDDPTRNVRKTVNQRHRILQLVSKAVGTARLIERGAAPDTATQCLVQQPVIDQQVESAVWRF